jgi:large subunit ribosomal protein L32
MAVPKRRVSKQRKRKRRTHYKAEAATVHNCPRCGDPKQPHRVCPGCGFYRGRSVLDVELD